MAGIRTSRFLEKNARPHTLSERTLSLVLVRGNDDAEDDEAEADGVNAAVAMASSKMRAALGEKSDRV